MHPQMLVSIACIILMSVFKAIAAYKDNKFMSVFTCISSSITEFACLSIVAIEEYFVAEKTKGVAYVTMSGYVYVMVVVACINLAATCVGVAQQLTIPTNNNLLE